MSGTGLDDALADLVPRLQVSASGAVRFDGEDLGTVGGPAALSQRLHHGYFCRRTAPVDLSRASGDGGFVAHLAASTRGASGWEPGFRLARQGHGWVFVSDGRLCLFLDEPGDYSPPEARVGEPVMVRVPRARENLTPNRFTLFGGAGPAPAGEPFVKLFVPLTLDGSASFVELLCSRACDRLAFTMYVVNDPRDFERVDAAVVDVSRRDEEALTRQLVDFARVHRGAVRVGAPLFARSIEAGISRADASGKEDAADGYGRRRCRWLADELWAGLMAGDRSAAAWKSRLAPLYRP